MLVYGKHIFESQCDLSGIQRICCKSEFYSLNSCDLIQPNAATGQKVTFQIVSYSQVVIFVAHEDCRAFFDGNVTLICFCFQVMDQQTLG